MRFSVSLGWLGYALDFSVGPMCDDEPECQSTEVPEFEPYQDAGSTGCTVIGFAPSQQPDWERPLNRYDEPSEGDEDV